MQFYYAAQRITITSLPFLAIEHLPVCQNQNANAPQSYRFATRGRRRNACPFMAAVPNMAQLLAAGPSLLSPVATAGPAGALIEMSSPCLLRKSSTCLVVVLRAFYADKSCNRSTRVLRLLDGCSLSCGLTMGLRG